MAALIDWAVADERTAGLGVGLFGASTGAAAALVAAAVRPDLVQAVVSRGGRPDPAGGYLDRGCQATLLIVGDDDPVVLQLNRQAVGRPPGKARLELRPGAVHLLREPGAAERGADAPASCEGPTCGGCALPVPGEGRGVL